MSKKRFMTMVGGTVACALGIGFFMQRAETAAPRALMAMLPSPVQQMVLRPSGAVGTEESGLMSLSGVTLASAVPDMVLPSRLIEPLLESAKPDEAPASTPASTMTLPQAPSDPDMPKLGCNVSATTSLGPMAVVDLDVSAPCFKNERVTIHHSGMMFTDVTDDQGHLAVSIPALSEQAVFIVAFADGKGTVAMANVSTLHAYDRVVLQWSDQAGFQVHAREFGAAYGESGHVWSGAAMVDNQQNHGFVTRLGEADTLAPRLAEVYTFPTGAASRSGTVALSIEAEVTAANCGRDISAQSLELRDAETLRIRELVLSVPNCSATGDFLVLNNLVEDLKIAAK